MSAAELDLHVETESRADRALAGRGARAGRIRPGRCRPSSPAPRRRPAPRGRPPRARLPGGHARFESCSSVSSLAAHPTAPGRILPVPTARLDPLARAAASSTSGRCTIHMYGLMLLLAIAACVGLTGIRWTRLGGDWDLVLRVAVWGVAAGIVGARLYHVITSWDEVPDEWWGPFAVWKGGLGVWGGILFGCSPAPSSSTAPARASGCSWTRSRRACCSRRGSAAGATGSTRSSSASRPTCRGGSRSTSATGCRSTSLSDTFQPTFLYEFIYDLAMAGVLILIGWRFRIRPPGLFALYVTFYTLRAHLRGAAAGRPVARVRRRAPELLGLGCPLRAARSAFFVWWQFIHESGRPTVKRKPREIPRAGDGRPQGPRPPAPLASARASSASSSSTSTRSRGRSTCC